jgi:hypothetical protein
MAHSSSSNVTLDNLGQTQVLHAVTQPRLSSALCAEDVKDFVACRANSKVSSECKVQRVKLMGCYSNSIG